MRADTIRVATWLGGMGGTALILGWLITTGVPVQARDAAPRSNAKLCEVQAREDIAYYDGPEADQVRHKLDLYLPKGLTAFPVLVFIHGGSWLHGEKTYFGLNRNLAVHCAQHGIGTVLPNYRLSPAVKHPEHVKDAARAVAWVHGHIGTYGGRPEQLFVAGHSAGGHLAALLATDERYLKAVGLRIGDIKGVIPMSGVFRIPDQVSSFDRMFGTDDDVRQAASPTWQVSHRSSSATGSALPSFLILYADHDFPLCGKGPAETFGQALRAHHSVVELLETPNRNHLTILMNASKEGDPAGKALIDFIHTQCAKK